MAKTKKVSKKTKVRKALNFDDAFHYPFNRAKGLLNVFWVLLPIIGWFALGGYGIRIMQHFVRGEFDGLPVFKFGDHFKLGFFMFFKSIPFFLAYGFVSMIIMFIPVIGMLGHFFISLFIIPILTINFFNKETVEAYFEFGIVKYVFENFEDYVIALLKSIGLAIVFFIMIIVLVGWPAGSFTKNIFLGDFYGRRVKQ